MPSSLLPPASIDPADLGEDVDLDMEKRRRILDIYSRLDAESYYDLLGVVGNADKKQIKSAYYKLAPEFHPDSYFRKNLGSYKAKIEAIFTRITLAHDVLTLKQRRAEYDAYLEQTARNRTILETLSHTEKELRAVEEAIEQAVRATTPAPVEVAPNAPRPAPLSVDERKAILARKLAGQSFSKLAATRHRPEGTSPSTPPPPPAYTQPEAQRAAAETLRARYEAAKNEAIRSRVSNYQKQAEEALAAGDHAKAANAYRIASHFAPNDESLKERSREISKLAALALAAGYLKQGAYEENDGRWADASLSYSRAVEGRPDDAFAHERAAFAMIKAGGSGRRAIELARRAVELSSQVPDNHTTLARAYIAAGFGVSALAELDRALAAGPMDAQHKQIVAELREQAHRLNKLG